MATEINEEISYCFVYNKRLLEDKTITNRRCFDDYEFYQKINELNIVKVVNSEMCLCHVIVRIQIPLINQINIPTTLQLYSLSSNLSNSNNFNETKHFAINSSEFTENVSF